MLSKKNTFILNNERVEYKNSAIIGIYFVIINILNIVYSIFRLRIHFLIILQIAISIVVTILFIRDYFFDNEKKREYIIFLQKQSSKEIELKELFDIKLECGKYAEQNMKYNHFINRGEYDGKICFNIYLYTKKRTLVFIPKFKEEKIKLNYYQNVINFVITPSILGSNNVLEDVKKVRVKQFYSDEVFLHEKFIIFDEKASFLNSRLGIWLNRYLSNVIGFVFSVILFILLLYFAYNSAVDESFSKKILEWLFNIPELIDFFNNV